MEETDATISASMPPRIAPEHGDVGLDVLELWVGDRARIRHLLTNTFGFEPTDAELTPRRDEELECLGCGAVRLVLRQGLSPTSEAARHVDLHGDTVGDVALICANPPALIERAIAYGLSVIEEDSHAIIDMTGDGTICHSVRPSSLVPGYTEPGKGLRMQGVDHVACCLPVGSLDRIASAYKEVFGLEPVDVGDANRVGDDVVGMSSVALRSRLGFTVVLTEPASSTGGGQTQRFLDAHGGPGIQHAAVAYEDLPVAVESLQSSGVEFLRAPAAYYEESQTRLSKQILPWDTLRRLDILVDADDDGLLFQLFTRPITDRGTFFIELIQRSGASGFGANNVRALFAAIEAAARKEPGSDSPEGVTWGT